MFSKSLYKIQPIPEWNTTFRQNLTDHRIPWDIGWYNYMKQQHLPAAIVIDARFERDLILTLKALAAINDKREAGSQITLRAAAGWRSANTDTCCCFPWSVVQNNTYGASFSFSPVVAGGFENSAKTQIIVRFDPNYHDAIPIGPGQPLDLNSSSPINKLPVTLVEVNAGTQYTQLSDILRTHNLSLSTLPMIGFTTLPGVTATAGHGSGKEQGAEASLVAGGRIIDMDGNVKTLDETNPDFHTLMGAHSGLLGVFSKITVKAVQAFNLRESIILFKNTQEMKGKLSNILLNNDYVSFLGMPSSDKTAIGKSVNRWQIREWNYTTDKPTQNHLPSYAPGPASLLQEFEVDAGGSIMNFLLQSGLTHLMPGLMTLSAAEVFGSRGDKTIVDFENKITHPQTSFPRNMLDVSYIIPIDMNQAGATLEMILEKMEQLIDEAATRNEFPMTEGVYVRFIKGTNGGLSTSATKSENERVLMIDIVTNPYTTGIKRFQYNFLSFLRGKGLTVRHHLGKDFPYGVTRYIDFLERKDIEAFISALERWYATNPEKTNGAERLAKSPFYTPYLRAMLDVTVAPQLVLTPPPEEEEKAVVYSPQEVINFLARLIPSIDSKVMSTEASNKAKEEFLQQCNEALANKKQESTASVMV